MVQVTQISGRRPRVDEVYQYLFEEITSLRLRPGDKISEADVAARFGVSRQPVRDAFSRLNNMGLLLIRPQRATEVRRFSTEAILKSRFVRAAVEIDVLRLAAAKCDAAGADLLGACMQRQEDAISRDDYTAFTALDYEFHKSLCDIAKVSFAFDVISSEKANVDRLCMLGLSKERRMPILVNDHRSITKSVIDGDVEGAVDHGKIHLSRLDSTISTIYKDYPNYFEPETVQTVVKQRSFSTDNTLNLQFSRQD